MVVGVVVPLVTALVTLAGGWLVSARIADRWDEIKKRREMNLAAAAEFQHLYGEFFAVWKVWNAALRYDSFRDQPPEFARTCLHRAAAIEGKLEALLAKIVVEYVLSDDEIDSLGALRQGFQMLRQSIQHTEPLQWWASGSPAYVAFKALATDMSMLLGTTRQRRPVPDAAAATNSFLRITDNGYETAWVAVAHRLHGTPPEPVPTAAPPGGPAEASSHEGRRPPT